MLNKTRKKENVVAVRTLYDCSHARVCGSRIYCDKGYTLSRASRDGGISIDRLESGMPLGLAVCRNCIDFDCMGAPVPDDEKGWLELKAMRRINDE